MSERLERWKAAEKVRSHVGRFAIIMGVGGFLGIFGGLVLLGLRIGGIGGHHVSGTCAGVRVPEAFAIPSLILMGLVLLLCARGLWKAQSWARWMAVALSAYSIADSVLLFVTEGVINPGVVFPLFVLVYLLLPSTGRQFARAQGSLPSADAP